MRGLQKMLATGAMGGLAAATVAASGAFACSPVSTLVVNGVNDNTVVPGQKLDIEVKLVDSTGGDVEVSWFKTPENEQIDVLIPRSPSRSFVGVTRTITIPASPARNVPYAIVVSQWDPKDPSKAPTTGSSPRMLYILPPRQAPQPQPPAPTGPDAELSRAITPGAATVTRPDGTQAPAGTPAPGVSAPAGSNDAAPVAGAPAPSQTDSVLSPQPGSASAPQATATSDQPGIRPAIAGEAARTASPTNADLWSGLDADKAPSLLDTPVTTSDSGAPMGGILLGAGVIALAGVALAATRRRLALVTRR